ncbi:hypothetical protein DKL61_09715 [Gammaproteobacteria bacterium ESL0073]|nr:hypothetical protein DKL61_09715 [Gammaproteobacteria bacterium ESL0073]
MALFTSSSASLMVDRALNDQIPNLSYQTRDFNVLEAIAIGKYVGESGASGGVAFGVGATTSHHQKLVLVDYDTRNPRDALAFVMGHNMHRSYWDTKEHYYYAADAGRPVGFIPWQDGSTKVRSSMLFDINDNIVKAWRRERKPSSIFSKHVL